MPDIQPVSVVELSSPAKINLGLEVVRRRDGGYHEIVTLLQMVDLADAITITPSNSFEYVSPVTESEEDDLIFKAIKAFEQATSYRLRAHISLRKAIPNAAGLGGGSSNAGTMLKWLGTHTGSTRTELHSIAASLGSDVPFFLNGPAALATGRGTELTTVDHSTRFAVVAVTPVGDIHAKTAAMYGSLTPEDFSDGDATHQIAEHLKQGKFSSARLQNSFGRPCRAISEIKSAWIALESAGASHIIPSGAGPTLLSFCSNDAEARIILARLRQRDYRFSGILRPWQEVTPARN